MAPPVRIVLSARNPAIFYRVSRRGCTCPSFQFRRRKDPTYRCKHMEGLFPFICMTCGQAQAAAGRTQCLTCLHQYAQPAVSAAAVAVPAFARSAACIRCGDRYAWTDQYPLLCPTCEFGHGWDRAQVSA